MASVKNVLIVGGGIGGLTLATALGRRGIASDIVERSSGPDALGSGLAQPANALRALQSVGLLEGCLAEGFGADAYTYFDPDGSLLAERNGPRLVGADVPSYNLIFRPALQRVLTDGATQFAAIRYGTEVSSLREVADTVEVTFSDGSVASYDLVVGADGVRSSIRRLVVGDEHGPIFTGQSCWRALGRRPRDLTYGAVYLGCGIRVGAVPISDAQMYVFIVTNDATTERIPAHDMLPRVDAYLEGFGGFIPEIRAGFSAETEISYTAIEEVLLPPPWYRGRVVLIGDAAHACGPHIGQGGAMAVEDAVVLAELLADDAPVELVLERFVARRYERCRFVQNWSREVGDQNRIVDPDACRRRNDAIRATADQPLRPHEVRAMEPI